MLSADFPMMFRARLQQKREVTICMTIRGPLTMAEQTVATCQHKAGSLSDFRGSSAS